MKKYTLLSFFIIVVSAIASAQNTDQAEPEKKITDRKEKNTKVEQIKRENGAPNSKDYKNEEDYLKAKEIWVEKNKNLYNEIVGRVKEN